jgi:copper(I)-binding protein
MRSGVSMNYCKFHAGICLLLAGQCAAQVQVENAWVQLAPPAATVNAAYMQIHNPLSQAQTIIGARADCCAMVMLHQTRKNGDKVFMDHLEQLVIPAQSSVQLTPGGLHIMLMHATRELTLDSPVIISFDFDNGHTQDIELHVKNTRQ